MPQKYSSKRIGDTGQQQGFALVIAIMLMSFVVLLLLSMVTLTRVETEVSTQRQQAIIARQNAMLAVSVAVGQLQKYSGPDQRVTATADLAAAANGEQWSSGAGGTPVNSARTRGALSGVQDGSRYWTGVWGNPDDATAIYSQAPEPALLTWLISGNETGPDFISAVNGRLEVFPDPDLLPVIPSQSIGGLSSSDATSGNVTIGSESGILLLGPNTVTEIADYVVAPLVSISEESRGAGQYAWWIGDEGVKTKANLTDPYFEASDTQSVAGRYRSLTAQRPAIELVSNLGGYPANDGRLRFVKNNLEMVMLNGGLTENNIKQHYHDLTMHSAGVLASSQSGGLRYDLTGFVESGTGLSGQMLPNDNSLFAGASLIKSPEWALLQSYNELADIPDPVPLRAGSETVYGISPVLSQLRFLVSYRVGGDSRLYFAVRPVVVLGNPYSRPISGSLDLRLDTFSTPNGVWARIETSGSSPKSVETQFREVMQNVVLRIPATTIEPGEQRVWSLDQDWTATGVIEMEEGFNPLSVITYDTGVDLEQEDLDETFSLTGRSGGALTVSLREAGAPVGGQDAMLNLERVAIGPGGDGVTVNNLTFPSPGHLPDEDIHAFGLNLGIRSLSDPRPNTNVRPYADYNIRAKYIYRPQIHNASGTGLFDNPLYRNVLSQVDLVNRYDIYAQNLGTVRWGRFNSPSGVERMVLFDLPRRESSDESALFSLAQLQHLDLSGDSLHYSSSLQPGNVVGNSLANAYISRQFTSEERAGEFFYDTSYLLNATLWDDYFFSTAPQSGAFDPVTNDFPNSRIKPVNESVSSADLQDGARTAEHLYLDGAFNVNSTSVEAWHALLAGLRDISVNSENNLSGPFPRSIRQPFGSLDAELGNSNEAFAGFRNLDDDELRSLAEEIVKEVRYRGPFTSLAHFINRQPTAGTNALASETIDTRLGLAGALQTAINRDGLNAGFPVEDNRNPTAHGEANAYSDRVAPSGYITTGAPGWLTQADILQAIGPSLSARSDTFVIRAYGDALNPIQTGTGTPVVDSRVWCEAVVQRIPEYLLAEDDSSLHPSLANDVNNFFGRRYVVVSFRWLGQDEI